MKIKTYFKYNNYHYSLPYDYRIGYTTFFKYCDNEYLITNIYYKDSNITKHQPSHVGKTFITNIKTKEKKLINDKNCLSHNFTILNYDSNLYGIGGLVCKEKKDDCLQYSQGIYLVKFNDNYLFDISNVKLIITNDMLKEGKSVSTNKADSNLCVLYSHIKQKILLYTRYNYSCNVFNKNKIVIKAGIRGVQLFESNDLNEWSQSSIININTFDDNNDNYYQFKVSESINHGYFFCVASYIGNNGNGIKLLMSKDGINWDDKGIILNTKAKAHPQCSRYQPCGLIIENDILTVYYQDSYYKFDTNILKYKINILDYISIS